MVLHRPGVHPGGHHRLDQVGQLTQLYSVPRAESKRRTIYFKSEKIVKIHQHPFRGTFTFSGNKVHMRAARGRARRPRPRVRILYALD